MYRELGRRLMLIGSSLSSWLIAIAIAIAVDRDDYHAGRKIYWMSSMLQQKQEAVAKTTMLFVNVFPPSKKTVRSLKLCAVHVPSVLNAPVL